MRTSRGIRRVIVAATAAVMVATFTTGAGAQPAPIDRSPVCPPPGGGAGATFSDVAGTTHRASIECAAGYGITSGFGDGTYRPDRTITRGQMATFTRNLVETATGEPMPEGAPRFADTPGTTHDDAIRALAEAGIVQGRSPGRFEPGAPVRRDQMATFIANAIDWVADGEVDGSTPPPTSTRHFDDVEGTTHQGAIDRLASVGIVQGRAARRYDPGLDVPRGQMATFVMNAAAYLHTLEAWKPTQRETPGVTAPRPARPGVAETLAPQLETAAVVASSSFQQRAILSLTFSTPLAPTIDGQHLALVEPRTDRRLRGDAPGVTVTRGADARSVRMEIDFSAADQPLTVADLARFTTVAVDRGAVRRDAATTVLNAPGSLGLQAVGYEPGRSDGADLLRVERFRDHRGADDRAEVLVDFVFDRAPAELVDSARFQLVLDDGSTVQSYFARPAADPRRIEAFFVRPSGLDDADDLRDEVRRAGVRAGAAPGLAPQAVDVAGGGATDGPDLVEVVLHPGANAVVYRFDADLDDSSVAADRFRLGHLDGSTSSAPTRATVDGREVRVTFPSGQVDPRTVIRATVEAEAVTTPSSLPIPVLGTVVAPGDPNGIDAVGFGLRFPAGRTLAPGLDAVSAEPGIGPDEVIVTYRFDRPVSGLRHDRFVVIDEAGVATTATRCAAGDQPTAVLCEYRPGVATPVRVAGFQDGAFVGGTALGAVPTHADGIALR